MIVDLHIYSKCSDGNLTVEEIIKEAKARKIGFISITDHDSIDCQEEAISPSGEERNPLHNRGRVEHNLLAPRISQWKTDLAGPSRLPVRCEEQEAEG